MNILDRLKMELNKQDYFTDKEYIQFLSENNLDPNGTYNKEQQQRDLLLTVLDILNAIANDTDMMRKITDGTTGFTFGDAYKFLEKRINTLQQKISTLDVATDNSCVVNFFCKNR